MARAFATFPSQGKVVEPLAIIRIVDREGEVYAEPERDRIRLQKSQREENQIMTPQEAYIMTDILQSTVEYGTLARRRQLVGGFGDMPMAGKTGTTQNWSDAWTVGFSPYMTTAIWLGFDVRGNSLGRGLTGATAAGPAWAEYMKIIHDQLPPKEFPEPETGLIRRTVCSVSGLLPTEDCDDGTREEIFLIGTEPKTACDIHVFQRELDETMKNRFLDAIILEGAPSSCDYDFPELISPDSLSFPLDLEGELEDDLYIDENDYLD
jgi:penicillin-binding protein 1A